MPKDSVCAEVGVFGGDFSEHILRIVKPKTLHLIDPWKYEADEKYERSWYGGVFGVGQSHMDSLFESVRRRFRREIAAGTIVLHRSTSEAALRTLGAECLDWIYIDGNHLYEYVKSDLELGYRALKDAGYLSGDDYHSGGWWKEGVRDAVAEMRAICKTQMILDGQYILEKKST